MGGEGQLLGHCPLNHFMEGRGIHSFEAICKNGYGTHRVSNGTCAKMVKEIIEFSYINFFLQKVEIP